MTSIIQLSIAFSILIGTLTWAGEHYWALFFVCVGLVLIAFEFWCCYHGMDVSLSGNFWLLDKTNPVKARITAIVMGLFWAFLLGHLLWKW